MDKGRRVSRKEWCRWVDIPSDPREYIIGQVLTHITAFVSGAGIVLALMH